jgi:hypothetical protein
MLWMKPIAGKCRKFSLGFACITCGSRPGHKARLAVWCLVFMAGLFCSSAWSDIFHIDSVRINAPKIHNDSLIYTMDIHFLERPGSFWSYYDATNGTIVIEFLDALIVALPVKIPQGMPFLWFKVRKMDSEMALTKVASRINVTIDRGPSGGQFWNNDVRLVGNSTIRVIIWKEKAAPNKIREKTSRTVAITVGASALVVFAVIALIAL